MRVAAFGGPYSNPYALRAFLDDARNRNCEHLFCLGDLGGFGAEPEELWGLLKDGGVECIAGNYDVAIGRGDPDCGCGYRDPQDNHFAQIAYDYTRSHVSHQFAAWMAALPTERRETIGGLEVHFVHGSPIGLNDFFWESLPDAEVSRRVAASGAEVVLCTHSGLPWQRRVNETLVVNVGVLGRPANDGSRDVWYAVLDFSDGQAQAELVPLSYDWAAQAASMRTAGLPETFVETIETGWWTNCLQILPPLERSRGRFHIYRSELASGQEHDTLGGRDAEVAQPERPVVSLFGTALFPRILRITDLGLAERASAAVAHAASAEGFLDIRTTAAPTTARNGDLQAPELTLSRDGWYWDRSMSEKIAETNVPLAEVKRLVVENILSRAQNEGRLPRSYGCISAATSYGEKG